VFSAEGTTLEESSSLSRYPFFRVWVTQLLKMYNSSEADALFKRLDLELMENIDAQYFSEPREFR
jgi:hypothetical protein